MLTVKEKLALIRAKRLGLAVPQPTATTAEKTDDAAEGETEVEREPAEQTNFTTPTKSKRPPVQSLFQSPSPANTPTPVRIRRFRNDPRAARLHWRNKELARARRHVVRSAVNSDNYVYMTAPVPDEEKTPIVAVKTERKTGDEDGDAVDDQDGNDNDEEEDEEDDLEEDKEDDEELALRTAQELERMRDDSDVDDYENENDEQGIEFGDAGEENDDISPEFNGDDAAGAPDEENHGDKSLSGHDIPNDGKIEKKAEDNSKSTDNDGEIEKKAEDSNKPSMDNDGEIEMKAEDNKKPSDSIEDPPAGSKEKLTSASNKISDEKTTNVITSDTSPVNEESQKDDGKMDDVITAKETSEVIAQTSTDSANVSSLKATEDPTDAPSSGNVAELDKEKRPEATKKTVKKAGKKKKKGTTHKVQARLTFSSRPTTKSKETKSLCTNASSEGGSAVENKPVNKPNEKDDLRASESNHTDEPIETEEMRASQSSFTDDESEVVQRHRPRLSSSDDTEAVGAMFFEDEAEEDDDEPANADSDRELAERYTDDEEDDEDDDRDIKEVVPDTEQKEDDRVAIASLHRQWEMENEQKEIEAATNGGVRRLFTNADDFDSPRVIAGSSDDPAPVTADSGEVSAEGGVEGNSNKAKSDGSDEADGNGKDQKDEKNGEKKDAATDYMEAMFRRDDSRSAVIEVTARDEHEDKAHEARREQQRLLWKARQKFKTQLHESNDDSLCHLDLFGDADKDKSKNGHISIRKKLESACRPASTSNSDVVSEIENEAGKANGKSKTGKDKANEKGKKRSNPGSSDDSVMPEWLRQKTCLERRQQKRRRSVSVANWSFDHPGASKEKGKDKDQTTGSSKNVNKTGITSLGTGTAVRKSRTTSGVAVPLSTRQKRAALRHSRPPSIANAGGSGNSRSTSFKGLLSLLGTAAERHA